ncbi:hypothetical protein K227x_64070 [Rubripirellula lacrimiformis]|uniref:Uncharacterized protein n=1 Tax=Rubripirellula lacrimiformis TaxID=1930273 RepID=A0A517NLG2_9BACT|nr:ATP-binding protein [Rubripirellula lacrimiformis]QDT07977.1 hypothetical protein K227x_64070 [Rubripirellula lacrimiformis]
MTTIRATDVFTPSDYPIQTYIARDDERLENRLRDALATPGEIVSLSGPSKSGKTVLIQRVVGEDELIVITGAGLESGAMLWDRVLNWIGIPAESSEQASASFGGSISASAGGKAGIPLVAQGEASTELKGNASKTTGKSTSNVRGGLQQVASEIAGSDFVLLVDDFHYMPREIQSQVAREIKEAARLQVKICTASVPHRSDDVVRGNPELRGRIRAIDSDYWDIPHLVAIGDIGFPLLNVTLDPASLNFFATEASGSPQLMQALCLQVCFTMNIRDFQGEHKTLTLDQTVRDEILEETSTRTDFSSLVAKCHKGPNTRGTERKEYCLSDGSSGDVYRTVLLAMAADPPALSLNQHVLSERVKVACAGGTPFNSSLYQACSQIARIAVDMYPEQRVVEWDSDENVLDIVDPYLLFYLRWSKKLDSLART